MMRFSSSLERFTSGIKVFDKQCSSHIRFIGDFLLFDMISLNLCLSRRVSGDLPVLSPAPNRALDVSFWQQIRQLESAEWCCHGCRLMMNAKLSLFGALSWSIHIFCLLSLSFNLMICVAKNFFSAHVMSE
jgi:hypothetical protein